MPVILIECSSIAFDYPSDIHRRDKRFETLKQVKYVNQSVITVQSSTQSDVLLDSTIQ